MATPTTWNPFALDPIQLANSEGDIYVGPTATDAGAIVQSLVLINDITTPIAATLHYVKAGGSAGDDNLICDAIIVPGDGFPLAIIGGGGPLSVLNMEEDSKISGFAATASQITVLISGVTFAP